MEEIEVIKKTAGLQEGMRTEKEFREFYGLEAKDYPRLFHITPINRFVGRTKYSREQYKKYCCEYKGWGLALGLRY